MSTEAVGKYDDTQYEDVRPLDGSVNALTKLTSVVEDALDVLERRLAPVIQPAEPSESPEGLTAMRRPASPLKMRVDDVCTTLNRMERRVRDLCDRLDV